MGKDLNNFQREKKNIFSFDGSRTFLVLLQPFKKFFENQKRNHVYKTKELQAETGFQENDRIIICTPINAKLYSCSPRKSPPL